LINIHTSIHSTDCTMPTQWFLAIRSIYTANAYVEHTGKPHGKQLHFQINLCNIWVQRIFVQDIGTSNCDHNREAVTTVPDKFHCITKY